MDIRTGKFLRMPSLPSFVWAILAGIAAMIATWAKLPDDYNHKFIAIAVAGSIAAIGVFLEEGTRQRRRERRRAALEASRHQEITEGQGAIHADVRSTKAGVETVSEKIDTLVDHVRVPVKPPLIAVTASLGEPSLLVGGPQHHSKAWYHLTIHNDGGKSSFRVAITVDALFSEGMLVTGQQSLWWNSEEASKSLMQGEEADIELGYVERSAPDNRIVCMEIGCDARGTRPSCWKPRQSPSAARNAAMALR